MEFQSFLLVTPYGGILYARFFWQLEAQVGPILLFVRRCAWVPLNYPVQEASHQVAEAKPYLTQTQDCDQVLGQLWLEVEEFEELSLTVGFSILDVQIFKQATMELMVSIGYFELTAYVLVAPNVSATLSSLIQDLRIGKGMPIGADFVDPDDYVQGTSDGSRVSLNAVGLERAKPLRMRRMEDVECGMRLDPSILDPDPKRVLNNAQEDERLVWCIHDQVVDSEVFSLSMLTHVSDWIPIREAMEQLAFGTFLFFDATFHLGRWIEKRPMDDAWRVATLVASQQAER